MNYDDQLNECFITEKYKDHSANWVHTNVCKSLPIYGEHKGKKYCVLHYPNHEKIGEFRK